MCENRTKVNSTSPNPNPEISWLCLDTGVEQGPYLRPKQTGVYYVISGLYPLSSNESVFILEEHKYA